MSLPVGTRVRAESGHEGVVIATPPSFFEPRSIRPGWMVFVAWDHLGGGWTPEDYKLLDVVG